MSGCSHRITADGPLTIREVAPGRFSLTGTPADCVRIGLLHIAPDAKLVLSGINLGGNVGMDVTLSGTVAAAREAALHGWNAIAFSYYRARGHRFDWPKATKWATAILRRLIEAPPEARSFWNVNFPGIDAVQMPEVVTCNVDPLPLPLNYHRSEDQFHYATDYHDRARTPGHDVDVCFSGKITISRVRLF